MGSRCWIVITVFTFFYLPQTDSQECPNLWDKFYRTNSNINICIRRLPETVTWYDGEQQCQDWMGNPLAWNETLNNRMNQRAFEITETEIWSSLKLSNGKLFHSGAPKTTIGLFPFAPPNKTPVVQWMSDQPQLNSGDCVSISQNNTAEFSPCNQKKYMYCQRFPVEAKIGEEPTYCPDGFVGNVEWPKCYTYITEAATFSEASISCQQKGGRLLTIDGQLLLSGLDFKTADNLILHQTANYYYSVLNSNTTIPSTRLRFWYTDPSAVNKCGLMTYNDGSLSTMIIDDCASTISFMCEIDGQVKTDRDMKIDIEIVILTSDRLTFTQCNLSRPLLPGEDIFILVNDRPIRTTQGSSNVQYLGDISSLYPRILQNGYHRCEVRGLHNKQIWSKELYYEQRNAITFMGSVDVAPSLPETEVLKYNLATAPETNPPTGDSTPTYLLSEEWLLMVSYMNEFDGTTTHLNGYFTSQVDTFRNNGKSVDFRILLNLYQEYSVAGEQSTFTFIHDFLEKEMSRRSTNNNRDRRSVAGGFAFIPSSLQISSTMTCSGQYTHMESDLYITFLPVPYGSPTVSSEICITDKRPLATADCIGGIGKPTQLINVVINPKCIFSDFITSPVTDILKNLTTVDINAGNIKTVITTVKNKTSDPDILTSIDVIAIADVLVHIPNDTLINQGIVIDILDIIDNVLNVDPDKLKKSQNDGSATNRLLEVLDTISHTLDLENQSSMQFFRENILMDVFDITSMTSPVIGIQIEAGWTQSLTTSNIQNLMADTNITVGKIDAAIILPVELINNINKAPINNSTRVALSIYRNWNLFSVRSGIREYLPNSRVMSASISVDGIPIYSLGEYRVQALFFPRMESENNECGYWNYDLHDKSGGWATSGCQLNRTEYGRHVCVCDHLTNFAVLVNIGGQDTLVDSLAINIITWIGLILSIAGLSLTILSFFLFKHLRKGRAQQTLFNLALAMLCFLIVFVVGIEQTHDFYGCIVVAVLLHYFILVSFMWMLMEGILQYLRFVKVLGTYIPHFILKTAVPAWGVPLIPVIVVVAIDHEMYHGGKKACWMSLTAFYYAFAIPVGIIILANAIIFGMILKNLLGRPKGLQSNQSERKRAMMSLRAAFSVFVLLGLTWIFGFFTIEEASIVFQYIFTILNVFQGFLIFILFTAREKQVRQNWKKLCCKEKPRDKYAKCESSSEMNKMRIRNNVNNSGSDTKSTGLSHSSSH